MTGEPVILEYSITVRHDDGTIRTITNPAPAPDDRGCGGAWVPLNSRWGLSLDIQKRPRYFTSNNSGPVNA